MLPTPDQTRKRVLIVGNFLSASGKASRGVCEDLAARLEQAGWQVVTTSAYAGRGRRLADMLLTAWRKRQSYRVAHVDVYSGPAFFLAEAVCWVLRRAGKPYVLTLHGGGLPAFARRWPARVRTLLRSASVVTTPSSYLLEQIAPYRTELKLLPNPLNLAAYDFRLRQQPTPCLIWLRAFHHLYNPQLAPQVVAYLATDFPDIRLIMVGPDKGDGSLGETQTLADRLGVAGHIRYVGGVPKQDVPHWLNQGDIFLNTTNVDNTPVSVLEAMACGLVIVTTNVGGIPYLVQHDQDARLVPANDAAAMANAVREALTTPDLAVRLSAHARAKTERMDWSVILPQWEQILSQI
ncbi:MAG: glycosyltransferase family 4 protein [Anaerolineae bacterium]|nr:glycosyltransferase family 4 protein [Anaerolineae bacterium]